MWPMAEGEVKVELHVAKALHTHIKNPTVGVELTDQQLREWQDSVVLRAKELLERDNKLSPVMLILAVNGLVDQEMLKYLQPIDDREKGEEVDPTGTGVYLISTALDVQTMYDVFLNQMINEDGRRAVEEVMRVGEKLGIPDDRRKRHVLKVTMAQLGFSEKDVLAVLLRYVLQKTKALAYLKVDEAYRKVVDGEKMTPEQADRRFQDLSKDPTSEEAALVFLETHGIQRMVTLPFTRTERDVGKITGFGEVTSQERYRGDSESESDFRGRFTNLIERSETEVQS